VVPELSRVTSVRRDHAKTRILPALRVVASSRLTLTPEENER